MNRKTEKRGIEKGKVPGKTSFIFYVFAFLLSSFSMFVLGVFVGRGQAPITFKINDIKAEIASVGDRKKQEIKREEIDKKVVIKKETKPYEKKKKEEKQKKKTEIKKTEVKRPANKESFYKGNFSIQVGAFKFENDADGLVKKLKNDKLPAFKIVSKSNGEIWYRVRVGSFKTRDDAKKLLIKLKNKKFDAFLVR